eukprot:CAMPEP_0194235648 /NCGR_PEP_ID=MMETSP0158-20130606/3084_1 /TAXON_ID=33649 /ORGANISM="Thalassionema nitzschioides, Strain L26-B" /LENGTH=127 /DNA_ID=CAMNT_0038969167 /DNA_START=41 /DNA_END=424 /DNA_ORIENTATION=-
MKLLVIAYLCIAVAAFSPVPRAHLNCASNSEKSPVKFTVEKNTAFLTGVLSSQFIAKAAYAVDNLEVAELPPPYVPVAFGILVLGGVGWLTSSLGNVMDEEALLGMQSGARAKKEMERGKSSYFKKR